MRAAVLAVLLASSIAHAQPPGLTDPTVDQPLKLKKKSTAMWLTLGTMAAGAGLFAAGEALYQQPGCYNSCLPQQGLAIVGGAALLVGPSVGHIYAGHTWNAGLGIRLGGMTTFALGWLALAPCFVHPAAVQTPVDPQNNGSSSTCAIGGAAVALGAIATVAGTVTEVATTPSAVEDYNRAHAALTVAPIQTQNGIAPGVALAGRF
jgi:hypothetical protein